MGSQITPRNCRFCYNSTLCKNILLKLINFCNFRIFAIACSFWHSNHWLPFMRSCGWWRGKAIKKYYNKSNVLFFTSVCADICDIVISGCVFTYIKATHIHKRIWFHKSHKSSSEFSHVKEKVLAAHFLR